MFKRFPILMVCFLGGAMWIGMTHGTVTLLGNMYS